MMKEYRQHRANGHDKLDAFILAVPIWAVLGVAAFVGITASLLIQQ